MHSRIQLLLNLLVVVALALSTSAATAPCFAAAQDVEVLVRLESGEIEFHNSGVTSADVVGYSLESTSSGLLFDDWQPIAGRLDDAGDGSFDPVGSWLVLSETGSLTDLSEGVLSGNGGTLAAGELLSIGNAWNLSAASELTATILSGNDTFAATVTFTPLGDYDWDGDVDTDDYALWRTDFGSSTNLQADGNDNGIIDAADYTIWRDGLAQFLAMPIGTGSSFTAAASSAIPEPATIMLLFTCSTGIFRRRSDR